MTPPTPPPPPDWPALDWRKTCAQIAAETGQSKTRVWHMRQQHAPNTATMKGRCGRKQKHPGTVWAALDWSLSNERLSQLTLCSECTVWRQRQQYAPETCTMKGRCGRKPVAVDWSTVDWRVSTGELSHMLGVNLSTVTRYRRKHAPETVRGYHQKRLEPPTL